MKWGRSTKKEESVQHPCAPSAIRPVPHLENLPISEPTKNYEIEKDEAEEEEEYVNEPHRLNQTELSNLVRDLHLSNEQAEFLTSRLNQWHLLQPELKITKYRTRHKNLLYSFEKKKHVVACIDVNGMMNFLNITHDPRKWKLYIVDYSELSLKATAQRQPSSFHSNWTLCSHGVNLLEESL